MRPGPPSQKQYQEMGYKKLHVEVKRMLAQAERQVKWFNTGARQRILVALMAMKELTSRPGQRTDIIGSDLDRPSYQQELLLLGLNADRVRQWKHRTQAERDIRLLAGEEYRPMRRREAITDQDFQTAVSAALRLCATILEGEFDVAEQLAQRYEEKYGL